MPNNKVTKLAMLGLLTGGLLGYVSSVTFLWVIHVSESPMNPFDPNSFGASVKATIVGALIGFLVGLLVAKKVPR